LSNYITETKAGFLSNIFLWVIPIRRVWAQRNFGGESINACWLFIGAEEAKNKKKDLAVERTDETSSHRKDNSPRENIPEGK
jgi:hypothetical protein